jgi:ubiquinone/menaquinone biosynthesis C-methylase UbiE
MSESWKKAAATERFDAWSSEYEQGIWWRLFFKRLHDRLVSIIGDANGLAVLDIGCGTGALLRRLADGGAAKLAGVDASEGMLAEARRLAGNRPIEFFYSPAHELPFEDGTFDVVTTNIAFHHFAEPAQVIREMARVLKPGGRVLICDLNGEGLGGRMMIAHGRRKGDLYHYTRREVERMMKDAGLRVESSRMVRRVPPAHLVEAVKPV